MFFAEHVQAIQHRGDACFVGESSGVSGNRFVLRLPAR